MGYVAHHQLEPAVVGIPWSLIPGQLSAPFQGRFGYEIVQVEERRIQPLDAIRESIIGNLKAAALERREQEIISAHMSVWNQRSWTEVFLARRVLSTCRIG